MPLEIIVGAVVGAAATSVVANEPIRRRVRQGLVYGLAGLLVACDKVASLTRGAVDGARKLVSEASSQTTATAAPAPANGTPAPANGAPVPAANSAAATPS